MKRKSIILALVLWGGCEDSGTLTGLDLKSTDWLVDTDYVQQGCFAGKDCIPSLENPDRSSPGGEFLTFLDDKDLVVGLWNGTDYVAYPHSILDWHEIVNEKGYTVSYCPLTGSALHIRTDGEYGVSGLLYNSNLIMYDRTTDSYWPQMLLKSAAGKKKGTRLELLPLIETTWGKWKTLFPGTKVINENTGHLRDYTSYPYGSYKTCNSSACGDYIYFSLTSLDTRLPAKDRVLAVFGGSEVKAFPLDAFSTPTAIQDSLDGIPVTIVVSGTDNIAIAYQTDKKVSISEWEPESGSIILTDGSEGGRWNILGQVLDESNESNDLKTADSYIAYWFSLAAYYPEVKIYQP